MKELFIIWGTIVCFILISANSKRAYLFSNSGGGMSFGGGYGRGWDWGSGGGGGFHK